MLLGYDYPPPNPQAGDHQQGHAIAWEVEALPGGPNNFGTGYIFSALFASTIHDVQKN